MLEVEILNKDYIIEFKNYLKRTSIPFYEDFLLDYVVFIKANDEIKEQLYNNPKLKIHTGNFAYQMSSNLTINSLLFEDIISEDKMKLSSKEVKKSLRNILSSN